MNCVRAWRLSLKSSPLEPSPRWGGLGGGDVSRRTTRDMKKHPIDGAHARARTLRQNITEAEKRVWQILRSHQIKGYKFCRQVPIGRYIADFVCQEGPVDRGSRRRPTQPLIAAGSRAKWVPAKPRLSHSALLEQRGPGKSRRRPSDDSPRARQYHPPRPSPIKGEGFCATTARGQRSDGNGTDSPLTLPSPVGGEG
jgi:Protein of unknown function (DUF559)